MALRIERANAESGTPPAKLNPTGLVGGKRKTHKGWVLTPQAFDRLLAAFHEDRERAGEEYERLRRVLVTFFDWRGCRAAEELADETFNRVARRLEEGEIVRNIADYCHGVARRLVFEAIPAQNRMQEDPDDFQHLMARIEDSDERAERERRFECFECSLAKLSEEDRTLVISYYQTEKRAKIDNRIAISEALGINLNSLRVRVYRIRARLEQSIAECLGCP